MQDILNLARFPLHQPDNDAYAALVQRCKDELARDGMCNLEGFLRPEIAQQAADATAPAFASDAFTHERRHNIYFKKSLPYLPADHPALQEFETRNLTLCADQLADSPAMKVYEWAPLHRFLALIMGKSALHTMADALARVNIMSYGPGDALNWHFDRSEFTTTLLLQAPESGGAFEYRTDLRTPDDANYDGVARLLRGEDRETQQMTVIPGTLNVFRGINTPHRVTPVEGAKPRIIAVYSYYDRPGVVFTPEEQIGFYGRSV